MRREIERRRRELMPDSRRPVTAPSERDDLLLERLRDIARERDGVPDEVLATARALFARVRAEHAGSERKP
jgi:hypothetical protein